jgi:hypothetical protein
MEVAGSVLWWDQLPYGKRRLVGSAPWTSGPPVHRASCWSTGWQVRPGERPGGPARLLPEGPAMADWSFSFNGSSNGWCDGVHIVVDNNLPLSHQQPPSSPLLHRRIRMLFQFFLISSTNNGASGAILSSMNDWVWSWIPLCPFATSVTSSQTAHCGFNFFLVFILYFFTLVYYTGSGRQELLRMRLMQGGKGKIRRFLRCRSRVVCGRRRGFNFCGDKSFVI